MQDNSYYYVDGDGTEHMIYEGGEHLTRYPEWRSDTGISSVATLHSEDMPDKYANFTRGVTYPSRTYSFRVLVTACDAGTLDTYLRELEMFHDRELGMGYLKRINNNGVTRCLDCYLQSMAIQEFKGLEPTGAWVTLTYLADVPWWRDSTLTTATGNFNGIVPVNIACTNSGDIPAWLYIVLTGIVDTPLLTNSAGDWLEIRHDNDEAADVIIADCRPSGATRRTVKAYEDGVGAGVLVATTGGSKPLSIARGTNNLAIVGLVGAVATCDLYWYNYYGSLY